ncbi:hypothetical protein PVAP13_3KG166627 [Panicum virgatum]|uniref:Uncharacterized protein n=1 Tax=Panicum virgatum TaxID=38727 RepID=A0A8T0UKV9_PANVG|nr:hypothetical protein PVAP13_3KG166627 [Panicum virgatum]
MAMGRKDQPPIQVLLRSMCRLRPLVTPRPSQSRRYWRRSRPSSSALLRQCPCRLEAASNRNGMTLWGSGE